MDIVGQFDSIGEYKVFNAGQLNLRGFFRLHTSNNSLEVVHYGFTRCTCKVFHEITDSLPKSF